MAIRRLCTSNSQQGGDQSETQELRKAYKRPTGVSHYDVVGAADCASTSDIRKAYVLRARELHPDVNPDDPQAAEKFMDLQKSYQILSDPLKRSSYDDTRKKDKK